MFLFTRKQLDRLGIYILFKRIFGWHGQTCLSVFILINIGKKYIKEGVIDNKGLINERDPQNLIPVLSHISIDMQTIIEIISFYARNGNKRQTKNRMDQAIE